MNFYYPPNSTATPQSALLVSQVDMLQKLETATSAELHAYQANALGNLLKHAYRYSSFWRERIGSVENGKKNAIDMLKGMPILARNDIQDNFEAMRARPAEMSAERIITATSSGSTGTPVHVEKDGPVYGLFYAANSWLESIWHRRDPRQKIALTVMSTEQTSRSDWGGPFEVMGYHGLSVSRGWYRGDAASHLDWLLREKPMYMRCTASIATELAELALQRGDQLQIKQILSQSERVSPKHRELCMRAFGANITDRYSCEETGWLAIQCPEQQQLHVLSGTVFLEILDDNNEPCPPGVVGRVVITSLHSFAMPIIRYELGDLAEWGPPCACGVTLPVIGALRGRIRHRVQLPNGNATMPYLGDELGDIAAIRQFRIVQHSTLALELQVATSAALSKQDIDSIQQIFRNNGLGALPLSISVLKEIDWPKGRKREEFVPFNPPTVLSPAELPQQCEHD